MTAPKVVIVAGRHNLERYYRAVVDASALYDIASDEPALPAQRESQ